MKKLVKIGALLFIGAAFAGAMTSCDDEYPKPGQVPVVAETHNISGMVIDRSGEGLEGVELTLSTGEKATTNSVGYFVFPDVKIGDYGITATKEGYIEAKTSVKISNEADGMNAVWNVMLLSVDTKKDFQVSTTTVTTLTNAMETGHIKGNNNGSVDVSIEVPADAFDGATGDNVTISIVPIYDEDQAISRTDDGEIMLVGATITCSDPKVKLHEGKTIALSFQLDNAADLVDARKYDGNDFVAYNNVEITSRANNMVIINADEINASYGLFAGVVFDKTMSEKSLAFKPSEIDNLNGNKSIKITSCAYSFGVGTSIDLNRSGDNKTVALLNEAIAMRYGANATIVDATYPVDITLPVGSYFRIWGSQEIFHITATCNGIKATATSYGNVKIDTKITTTADHNGGSN